MFPFQWRGLHVYVRDANVDIRVPFLEVRAMFCVTKVYATREWKEIRRTVTHIRHWCHVLSILQIMQVSREEELTHMSEHSHKLHP
jgi:hypothetical protein